jgi:hypothetical protein
VSILEELYLNEAGEKLYLDEVYNNYMSLEISVIKGIVMSIFMSSTIATAYASTSIANEDYTEEERESGFYDEEGYVMDTELRPAINPDFDPDEDCNLAYKLKCIPGLQQKCSDLEGFNNGENNVCTPIECNQKGYVGADEDEHGLCISYERCENDYTGYVLIKDEARCAVGVDVCNEPEHSSKDYCVEFCEENPDRNACSSNELEVKSTIFCDGKTRDYEGISDLPKLEEDECYGTCEQMSKGLACDIEKRENN